MRLAKRLILTWVIAISAGGIYSGVAVADAPLIVAESFSR